MTGLLRASPDALAVAASRVEAATGIPMAHVEKDFWVTEVLRAVDAHSTETGVSAVFKGGTSLSKAYRLIRRFSEDVDVIAVVPGRSKGEDDRILKGFVQHVETATGISGVVDPSTATRGVKRTAAFAYPASTALGALRPVVRLELGARGGTMPTQKMAVTSLVAEHATAAGLGADIDSVPPVEMLVLAPVRTLVEKLVIVHHAAAIGNSDEQARQARHYYDLWCLLTDRDILAALREFPVDLLTREVVTFSQAAGLSTSNRPEGGFAASPAFDPTRTGAAREAFDSVVLAQLVWPDAPRPTFDDCCAIVHANADRL